MGHVKDSEPGGGRMFRWDSTTIIILVAFFATRIFLLAYNGQVSDVIHYDLLAQQGVDAGKVAYRDFDIEYPPVAWWLMRVPRLLDSRRYVESTPSLEIIQNYYSWYYPCFRLELFAADLACFALMFAIGQRLSRRARWVLPGGYILMTFAQPDLIYDRLDIVLLLFLLLSISCWLTSLAPSHNANRWACASYFFLGLGISFKIVPVVFVPFLLLADLRIAGGVSRIAARILSLIGGAVGPFLVHMPSAGWGVFSLFKYHGERGIHLESIWSSIVLAAGPFGVQSEAVVSHNGYDLTSAWSSTLNIVSTVSLLAMGASLGLWALRRGRGFDQRLALDTALLVLINSVVLAKVLSPQYLNWMLPLALLLALNIFPKSRLVWSGFVALIVVVLGISVWLFPYHYLELIALEAVPVACAVTRSGCLALLALLLNIGFFAKYGLAPRADGGQAFGTAAIAA